MKPFLLFVVRAVVGAIYFYSGFTKLTEPVENFIGVITSYEILPYAWAAPVAYGLPWIELLAGAF